MPSTSLHRCIYCIPLLIVLIVLCEQSRNGNLLIADITEPESHEKSTKHKSVKSKVKQEDDDKYVSTLQVTTWIISKHLSVQVAHFFALYFQLSLWAFSSSWAFAMTCCLASVPPSILPSLKTICESLCSFDMLWKTLSVYKVVKDEGIYLWPCLSIHISIFNIWFIWEENS